MRFYRHESCGQCTPCREGCGWIERILDKHREGQGDDRRARSASTRSRNDIMGNTICAFGDGDGDAGARPSCASSGSSSRSYARPASRAPREGASSHERARPRFLRLSRRWSRSLGALVTVLAHEPDPRRDGAACSPSSASPALFLAAQRAVPRGDPAHRLRGRGRRAVRLRHHAARPRRDAAARLQGACSRGRSPPSSSACSRCVTGFFMISRRRRARTRLARRSRRVRQHRARRARALHARPRAVRAHHGAPRRRGRRRGRRRRAAARAKRHALDRRMLAGPRAGAKRSKEAPMIARSNTTSSSPARSSRSAPSASSCAATCSCS